MLAGLIAATAALAAVPNASAQGPGAPPERPPRVVVMALPDRTTLADLAGIDGAAVGLLSGGLGRPPGSQTYLDIGQGARLSTSLYNGDVPVFLVDPREGISPLQWRSAVERVAGAPTDLVPGLLASSLAAAGIESRATPRAGAAAVIAADRDGRLELIDRCVDCPGLTVTGGDVDAAAAAAAALAPGDLLIAFERPPADEHRQLAVAFVGLGEGALTSDSTRTDGFVLSTDLAPTIVERFGLEVPGEMNGRPVRVEGEADLGAVEALDDRLSQIAPRRAGAVGWTMLLWAIATALAGAAFRARGLRTALPLLAVSVAYLPFVFLATAALEASEPAERLTAWLATPALAVATLAFARGWGALALACGVTVAAHAVDVVAGSPLTSLSLLGPNPAAGVRFYGIGNELEATLAALILIGTGAALVALAPQASPRARAVAFAAATVATVAVFAPGRFGADVGAAIGIPVGAAVAVAVTLRAGHARTVAILAAPVVALALLIALDLVLGGDAHLSRSVLEAGGLDQVGQVAERRIRLGVESFERYRTSPVLWATVALVVAGIAGRRRVAGWFSGHPGAWAGFLGAAAATVAGTLANDSGALLLMIGTALTSLCAGFAWAMRAQRG